MIPLLFRSMTTMPVLRGNPAGEFLAAAVVVDVEQHRGFGEGRELDAVTVEVEDEGVGWDGVLHAGAEIVERAGLDLGVPDYGVDQVWTFKKGLGELAGKDFGGDTRRAGAQQIGQRVVGVGVSTGGGVDVAKAEDVVGGGAEQGGVVGWCCRRLAVL
jgi:hypothetical protein